MAKPIQGIEPFTGKASEWLTRYLGSFDPDPEKQREAEEREEALSKRITIVLR